MNNNNKEPFHKQLNFNFRKRFLITKETFEVIWMF